MVLYNASVVIKNKKSGKNVKYLRVLAYNGAPYTTLLFPDVQLFAPYLILLSAENSDNCIVKNMRNI